ncbi:MAG: hypothetical protein M5R36_20445 [Deltaproteobacteria bacterium]|nr:hypothetical protein [Deltaproteobacteria bacterium]
MASIDEAYVDITGTERLFGTPRDVGLLVKERIFRALQLTASVGIGPNRLIAKIASDYRKPDGLTIVPSDDVAAFLAPLPITKIPGIGPRAESALEKIGVHTIGQLARKPLFRTGPAVRRKRRTLSL